MRERETEGVYGCARLRFKLSVLDPVEQVLYPKISRSLSVRPSGNGLNVCMCGCGCWCGCGRGCGCGCGCGFGCGFGCGVGVYTCVFVYLCVKVMQNILFTRTHPYIHSSLYS